MICITYIFAMEFCGKIKTLLNLPNIYSSQDPNN